MKQLIYLILFACLLTACDKETIVTSPTSSISSMEISTLPENQAQKQFAQILSKAVSQNEQMREFLKKEALKQFDKDYDVFYPYIKDQKIDGNSTFRDILISNSSKNKIEQIESSIPLLTIMIPDLSSFDAFSIKNGTLRIPKLLLAM